MKFIVICRDTQLTNYNIDADKTAILIEGDTMYEALMATVNSEPRISYHSSSSLEHFKSGNSSRQIITYDELIKRRVK